MTDGSTMRDRMLAGQPYLANDPELIAGLMRARRLTHRLNTMDPTDADARRELLTELLGSFGEDSEILPPFHCDFGNQTYLGARSGANYGLVCLDAAPVTIGDDVLIGPNVQLLTAAHPAEPGPRREKWQTARPITIGNNVWLGGGVIVCPGVTIGDNTVVGAGAVVMRNLPENVIAIGNPAKKLRRLAAPDDD